MNQPDVQRTEGGDESRPYRRVLIPKTFRPLTIARLRDKVVQEAWPASRIVLEAIYEPRFRLGAPIVRATPPREMAGSGREPRATCRSRLRPFPKCQSRVHKVGWVDPRRLLGSTEPSGSIYCFFENTIFFRAARSSCFFIPALGFTILIRYYPIERVPTRT